jgi:UDP-N-acetylglucosamine--N-acetylmuramyl-(pentapeptide) pyrophosphoryl-undecaprenol N-acetylglucosamine transferase
MAAVRILIAGGGTGGHVFPAIAIADEIIKREPNAEILFIGTRDKIESRVVPQRGYRFRPIWISGWSRRLRADSLLFPVKLITSMIQSWSILKKFRPDVVVGTGGYVCGPVVRTASFLGVPTAIQEQNSYPGVTTRMLAGKADRVFVSFDETRRHLKRSDNVIVTGNPTRGELDGVSREAALKAFGFDPNRPVLLAFGGSLGAASINGAVIGILPLLDRLGVQLIWATGEIAFESTQHIAAERRADRIVPFIDDMASALAAADVALCRAGATAIAELTRVGVPAILVPYPFAAANHQELNARTLAERGAARIIADNQLPDKLPAALEELFASAETRNEMRRRSKEMGNPNAGPAIAETILKLAKQATP